jgi:cysteine-rich repeat protein
MRTSIVGAAFLLVGAGAATVAAVDTTGNNIALNGSDTLHDVTVDVINSCTGTFADFAAQKITYNGGGSGVGAFAMQGNNQQISPMSRSLKNTEYCQNQETSPNNNGNQALTADLLVGIDGVAIVSNQVNNCTATVAGGVSTPTGNAANGFGTALTITNADSTTYTFTDSFDALKVLYFGLTHDNVYNCASPTRKSLISHWTNLFQNDCGAGDGTCNDAIHVQSGVAGTFTGGLTHAWRRSDLAGTTDAFYNILGNGGLPGGKGIGALPGVGPTSGQKKSNPFCNSLDAQTAGPATGTTFPTNFAGSADFSDNDPFRTECTPNDQVCGYTGKLANATGAGAFQGDLGIVIPILIPDGTVTKPGDIFQVGLPACTSVCALEQPIAGAVLPAGYLCPDGKPTVGGGCFMPLSQAGSPLCVAGTQTKCSSAAGNPDGRRYNLVTLIPPSQVPAAQKAFRATTPFQFAYDVDSNFVTSSAQYNPRFMTGSFHRIHQTTAGTHNVPVTGETNGLCQENDDTSQIGCLVDSDPCSIGYAGREASKYYPGVGVEATDLAPLKSFAISESAISVPLTPPFSPSPAPSQDEGLLNLLTANAITTAEPFYPLSRRLYFATTYGFGSLLNGEKELARCYANNSIVGPSIAAHGFVKVPTGVQCLDFPENIATASAPPPNTRGTGAVAIQVGCNAASNNNSCLSAATAPDICGDGILTPTEFALTGLSNPSGLVGCDDGNTLPGDGCSANCTVEAGFTCTNASPSVCTPTM